jgi:hypothetical protein
MAILSFLTAAPSKKARMSELDQSEKLELEGPKSDLYARVNALEGKVAELKRQGHGRVGRFTVLLGVIATILGVLSTVLSLKGTLFPAPHTAVTDHGIWLMHYQPESGALTFKVTITLCNDGNKDDVLDKAEVTLTTAHSKLTAAGLNLVDDKETTEDPPIIVRPGTLKMYLSPSFKYPPNEEGPVQLQIQFPEGKDKRVTAKICYSVEPADLEQASQELPLGYELSTSNCEPGRN